MNYLAVVKKHMKEVEGAYGKIVTEETRGKAVEVIQGGVARMGIPAVFVGMPGVVGGHGIKADVTISEALGVTGCAGVESPVESKETATVGFPAVGTMTVGSVTTVYPAEYRDKVWPGVGKVVVGARCINPKVLSGKLEDGRGVSLERGYRNYKVGDVVEAELVRGGGSPLYRVVGTKV